MKPIRTAELDIEDLATIHDRIRTQKLSPVEVLAGCLKRIEQVNPQLNAFITVLADQALAQATAAEVEIKAGKWRGPLHGIPVAIKDFYDTAGIKTTAAFERFKDRVTHKDAVGVAKLKEAGAVIIGKTNMHRLGEGTTGLDSYFGPVHNAWSAEHIAGGSSSGSAAAVATGMCYATLDTDAIGSCRLPAACCGVVGFKGTYGLISPVRILEGEEDPGEMIRWFSHPGIMTRTVEDTALVLDVLAERKERKAGDYFDGLAKRRKLRLGVADNFRAQPEIKRAFEVTVEQIRCFNYPLKSVDVPSWNPRMGLQNIDSDRKAIAARAFKDIDLLLLPTTTTTVPTIKAGRSNAQALSAEDTIFANYFGLPSISVPCGFDSNGLPLGLQLVGRPCGEASVLQLAHQFERLNSGEIPR